MPAKPPAPGAVQLKFEHSEQGRVWSFSLFYGDGTTSEYTTGDLTALGNAAATAWGSTSHGVGRMHTDVTFLGLVATDLFSNTAPRVDITDGTAGQSTGSVLPMNVAMVIQRIQDRRYRGGKSHIYLCGYDISNLDTDENFFKAASYTAVASDIGLIDAAAAALTTSHGFHWQPIVVSYFNGHAERISPVLFHVTGNAGQPRVCSRRRRLPKI